ncbi:MAG: hypothetical protein KDD38_02220 [Bdellovibrionales bacterium]|nr:hypothetical protein [Bdellovibrionales bacterium]
MNKQLVKRWTLLLATIGLVALVLMTVQGSLPFRFNLFGGSSHNASAVTFEQVYPIFEKRCNSCHSQSPTDNTFKVAPKGVVFENESQIRMHSERIFQQVILSRVMPIGNKTQMTEPERMIMRRWLGR